MARMSREFKLVLLGAGLLTAGSFLWPEDDPAKRAEQDAANGGGGNRQANSGRRYHGGGIFIFTSFTRPSAPAGVASGGGSASRGGFGRSGSTFSGGG